MPHPEKVTPDWPTVVVANPRSRMGADMFSEALPLLKQEMNVTRSVLTENPDVLREVVQECLTDGTTRLVVAGGDGTVSKAANLITGTNLVLGVLPAGTGNTFWWGLGFGPHLDQWVQDLAHGDIETFDMGEATANGHRRLFLNSLTIGVSARLVDLLTPGAKQRWGWWAWPLELRRALASTPGIRVRLEWADGRDDFVTRQLVLANTQTLAGPIRSATDSSPADGYLDVFRLGGPSLWSMGRVTLRMLRGHLLKDKEARFRRIPSLSLSTEPAVAVDIDGDLWESTPLSVQTLPEAIRVIVPPLPNRRPTTFWPGTGPLASGFLTDVFPHGAHRQDLASKK